MVSMRSILFVLILLMLTIQVFAQMADELEKYEIAGSTTGSGIFAPDVSTQAGKPEMESTAPINSPDQVPVLKASGYSISNKDRVIHRENKLGGGRSGRGLIQWYGFESIQLDDSAEWLNFSGYKIIGSLDLRWSPQWMLSSSVGDASLRLHHFFGKTYEKPRSLTLLRSKLIYTPIHDTEIRLEGSNDFTYMGWLSEQQESQLITNRSYFAEVESFAIPYWQLRANIRQNELEDNNRQTLFDSLILREVISAPLNLKLGVSGGWNQYKKQQGNYWSPEYFENYGVRMIVAKDFTPEWWAETKFYYGIHQEINLRKGYDSNAEFSLQFRDRSGLLAKLIANYYEADSGGWWRNDIGLNLEVPY